MRERGGIPIRVLTHNIRYNTKDLTKNERPWEERRHKIIQELHFHTLYPETSLICLQEALHDQLHDILQGLNTSSAEDPEWAYIGVGRDDGKTAGEYSPVLFRPRIWSLFSWQTVWLSKTPEIPSKSWDAASIRILTCGTFRHNESHRTVIAMSTHLDDQGATSRFHAAHMILEHAYKASMEFKIPVFLGGDFNSEPDDKAYQVLTSSDSSMRDTMHAVAPSQRYGHSLTYVGFSEDDGPGSKIDFIFTGPKDVESQPEPEKRSPWTVKTYGVLENKFEDGIASSDHRAVVVDLLLH